MAFAHDTTVPTRAVLYLHSFRVHTVAVETLSLFWDKEINTHSIFSHLGDTLYQTVGAAAYPDLYMSHVQEYKRNAAKTSTVGKALGEIISCSVGTEVWKQECSSPSSTSRSTRSVEH